MSKKDEQSMNIRAGAREGERTTTSPIEVNIMLLLANHCLISENVHWLGLVVLLDKIWFVVHEVS